MRTYYIGQGTLLNALWCPKWEGNPKRRGYMYTYGFPGGVSGKEPTCQCRRHKRDMGLIPGPGRSPGGEHGNPLQYSCLENPMDRGAWRAAVRRIAELDTAEGT